MRTRKKNPFRRFLTGVRETGRAAKKAMFFTLMLPLLSACGGSNPSNIRNNVEEHKYLECKNLNASIKTGDRDPLGEEYIKPCLELFDPIERADCAVDCGVSKQSVSGDENKDVTIKDPIIKGDYLIVTIHKDGSVTGSIICTNESSVQFDIKKEEANEGAALMKFSIKYDRSDVFVRDVLVTANVFDSGPPIVSISFCDFKYVSGYDFKNNRE